MRSKSCILTTLLGACGALALEQQHDRTHHPVSTSISLFEGPPAETWLASPIDISLAQRDVYAIGAAATSSGDVTTPIALSRDTATSQAPLSAAIGGLGVSDLVMPVTTTLVDTVQSAPTSIVGSSVVGADSTMVGTLQSAPTSIVGPVASVQTTESPVASPVQTAASQIASPVGYVVASSVGSVLSGPVSNADPTSQAPVTTGPSSPAPQGVYSAAEIPSVAPTKVANAQTAITSVTAPITSDVPSQTAAPAAAQDTSLAASPTTLAAGVTSQAAPNPSTAAVQFLISTGNGASQTSNAAPTTQSPASNTPQIGSGTNISPTQDSKLTAATVLSQSTATSEPQRQVNPSSSTTQFGSFAQASAGSSATNAAPDSNSASSQAQAQTSAGSSAMNAASDSNSASFQVQTRVSAGSSVTNAASDSHSATAQAQTQNAESVTSSTASASSNSATQPSSNTPALITSSAIKKADKNVASSSNSSPSSTSGGTFASATSSSSNTAASGTSSITTTASLPTESGNSTETGDSSQTDSNNAAASQTSTLTLTSSTSTTMPAEHLLAGSPTSSYTSGTIIPSAATTPSNGTVASIASTPLSKAVDIGAIVGPVVGAASIVFALLGFCLWRRRRRQRRWAEYLHKRVQASEDFQEPESRWRRSNITLARDVEADGNEIYEADPDAEIHELDGEGCLAQVHRFFRELFELEGDTRHPTELEAIEDPQELEGNEPDCMTAVQQWFQRLFGEKRAQDFEEIENIDYLDEPRPSEKRRREGKRPIVQVSSPTDTSPDDDARSIDFIEELERNRKKMGARAERQQLGEGDDDDVGSIARSAMTGMTQLTEDRIDPLPRYTP